MANKHEETTQAARDGFEMVPYDAARHGLLTSPKHAAYCVGRWLRESGRAAPSEVRPSRGDLMHCNGMLVRLQWSDVRFPIISREK